MNFTLSVELDYSLSSLHERKNKVEEIIDRYDDELQNYYENYHKVNLSQNQKTSEFDQVTKDLEKMADYLLYMDNKEQRKLKNEQILDKNQTKNRKKKEYLTDNFTYVEEDKREIVKNNKIYGKIKVCEQDRKEHKELADTGRLIKSLKKQILYKKDLKGNDLTVEQIKKMRWYVIDIGKEEIAIKEQLKRYICFRNITISSPNYDLKNFSFRNTKHIKSLFDNYQSIKQTVCEKTDNDFKLLLFVFEDLVDRTIKEPILKRIFEMKIDGDTQESIRKEIFLTFSIDISQPRISQIVDEVIPNLIANQYQEDYEEWVYTFLTKGKYKSCPSCKKNKLANLKYFHKDNKTKDKLQSICKKCRKEKYTSK
jgi:hypothetical protein